jgi:hypothetical protein
VNIGPNASLHVSSQAARDEAQKAAETLAGIHSSYLMRELALRYVVGLLVADDEACRRGDTTPIQEVSELEELVDEDAHETGFEDHVNDFADHFGEDLYKEALRRVRGT